MNRIVFPAEVRKVVIGILGSVSVLSIVAYFTRNPEFFKWTGIVASVLVFVELIPILVKAVIHRKFFAGLSLILIGVVLFIVGRAITQMAQPDGLLLGLDFMGIIVCIVVVANRSLTDSFQTEMYERLSGRDDPESQRIVRIIDMEDRFNSINQLLANIEEDLDDYDDIHDFIPELKEYMDSGQWREDYEADERGELPEWLLRGVLSEDGLYNMLEDVKRIKERAEKVVGEGK